MARVIKPEEYMRSWETIQGLLDESGKFKKDLCQYLGISPNVATKWRNGTSASFVQYIDKIADYLNVSADYLLGISKEKYMVDALTSQERDIVEKYRKLDFKKRTVLENLLVTWENG